MKEKIKSAPVISRTKLIIYTGLAVLALTLISLHFFFLTIEERKGFQIDDWLLARIPAQNCSIFIFLIIWSMGTFLVVRVMKDPVLLMKFAWAYSFVCLSRMLTIYLVPLDPPKGLIDLADPLTGLIYGQHVVINKDLFYSGHTSILFLMFLCFTRKTDRYIALTATTVVATLLLVQHVHYTIDILVAPAMVYMVFKITEKALLMATAPPGKGIAVVNLQARPIRLKKKAVHEEVSQPHY